MRCIRLSRAAITHETQNLRAGVCSGTRSWHFRGAVLISEVVFTLWILTPLESSDCFTTRSQELPKTIRKHRCSHTIPNSSSPRVMKEQRKWLYGWGHHSMSNCIKGSQQWKAEKTTALGKRFLRSQEKTTENLTTQKVSNPRWLLCSFLRVFNHFGLKILRTI